MPLLPTARMGAVSGLVELAPGPGPFTLSVTADGAIRYAPTIALAGLPAPAALGRYATYVAWAAPPTMYPAVRLGVVTNGRTPLAPVALDKFVILVTAEASAGASEPTGPVVLRGESPSMRLQPPDLFQFALGATREEGGTAGGRDGGTGAMGGMAHHGAGDTMPRAPDSLRWSPVPMPRGLQMLPAEMVLRPGVAPYLPRAAAGAEPPAARPRELVRLRDGDTLRLTAGLVRRTLAGRTLTMYGFNGQYPGPLLQVPQGARVTVLYANALDQPSTVHWHGVRLDARSDGVPDLTQPAVPPGGRFVYHLRFPDAGIYWYHPHVREDAQQDLGLYGNLLVRSPRPDWYGPAHREEVLMLDDFLVGADGPVPYGREAATHALMGRFGNVFLVNGEPDRRLRVRRGEVVRFFLTNVSSARTFNLSFPGARMKVVAGDAGRFEREAWVESVVLAPAERYVVHVRFDRPGETALVNRVHALDHLYGRFYQETDTLARVTVADAPATPDLAAAFDTLRADTALGAELGRYRSAFDRAPDRTLVLDLATRDLPFVTRQVMQLDSIYFHPMEWSGTMPGMNWAATTRQVHWVLRDPATGRENMAIDWAFARGAVVKLRLVNERTAIHAMQHPIHVHGQRFLVLAVNGVKSGDLVWKDTVLVPAGATVDLLLDLSNPGRWMVHCHVLEHLSADMMMAFTVN